MAEEEAGGGAEEEAGADAPFTALDPLAAALAARVAQDDQALAAEATRYFRDQRRLVQITTEHLHEQREVLLSHLKLRRFTERLKAGVQVFLAAVAASIAFTFVLILYGALTSRYVVVDIFRAPADLAARGLTGEVVATDVLDGLQALQDATRASGKGLSSRGAWASDVKIEVPSTGISLGELDRLLHEHLGRDVHIEGELVQSADSITLTVRGDDVPAKEFTGRIPEIGKLATQAAEYIYGRSQPLLYAIYLQDSFRYEDAVAFISGAFVRAPADQRARIAHQWALGYGRLNKGAESISKDSLAMALAKPYSEIWWEAWDGKLQSAADSEEDGWRAAKTILAAAAGAWWWDKPALSSWLADDYELVWDFPMCLQAHLADAETNGGAGVGDLIAGPYAASTLVRMHDYAAAEQYLSASNPDDRFTKSVMLWETGLAALERGDAQAAIPPLEAARKWVAEVMKFDLSAVDFVCQLGQAYSMAGRLHDAIAIFDVGKNLSLCVALKGEALARSGNVPAAKAAWAAGLAAAPDLPPIYYYRGMTEAATGDDSGALADFRSANRQAPHWAEPLKAWGDLLAKQNNRPAAQAKYDEALNYAPHWAALQQAHRGAETPASTDR